MANLTSLLVKIFKGLKKLITEKFFRHIFFIFCLFKKTVSQKRIMGCEYCGPDGSFDTKIGEIEICHMPMSYVSYDIKCHIMTNGAYDI